MNSERFFCCYLFVLSVWNIWCVLHREVNATCRVSCRTLICELCLVCRPVLSSSFLPWGAHLRPPCSMLSAPAHRGCCTLEIWLSVIEKLKCKLYWILINLNFTGLRWLVATIVVSGGLDLRLLFCCLQLHVRQSSLRKRNTSPGLLPASLSLSFQASLKYVLLKIPCFWLLGNQASLPADCFLGWKSACYFLYLFYRSTVLFSFHTHFCACGLSHTCLCAHNFFPALQICAS